MSARAIRVRNRPSSSARFSRRQLVAGAVATGVAFRGLHMSARANQELANPIAWHDTAVVEERISAWGRMLPDEHLITYTLHPAAEPPTVVVARSDADWRNFDALSTIPSPEGYIQEQSHLVRLSDGSLLMAVRKRREDLTWFGLPVFKSVDGGQSWTELSTIDVNPDGGGQFDRGLWDPYLIALPDGRVAAFYASELHAADPPWYSQTISQRISDDGGVTWGPEILAVAESGTERPGMPGAAWLADGRLILVYEVCGTPNCTVSYKISDDGETWSDDLGTPIQDQRSGPFVAALTSGQILVTSACTNEVSISEDVGQTWMLNDAPAWDIQCQPGDDQPPWTWPAIYQISEREVVIVANVDGKVQLRFGSF